MGCSLSEQLSICLDDGTGESIIRGRGDQIEGGESDDWERSKDRAPQVKLTLLRAVERGCWGQGWAYCVKQDAIDAAAPPSQKGWRSVFAIVTCVSKV